VDVGLRRHHHTTSTTQADPDALTSTSSTRLITLGNQKKRGGIGKKGT